jgi:hypothetical protein
MVGLNKYYFRQLIRVNNRYHVALMQEGHVTSVLLFPIGSNFNMFRRKHKNNDGHYTKYFTNNLQKCQGHRERKGNSSHHRLGGIKEAW